MLNFIKKRQVVEYAVIQHSKEADEMGISTQFTGDFLKEILIIKSDGKTEWEVGRMDFNDDSIEDLNFQGIPVYDLTAGEELPNGILGKPLGKMVRGVLEHAKLLE